MNPFPKYKHKKTGDIYTVMCNAIMQSRGWGCDMESVVVYQGEDSKVWVRPLKEFHDRFERATD